jgi:hypothetical protein
LNDANFIWFPNNFCPAQQLKKTRERETYTAAKHSSRMKTVVIVVGSLLVVLLASMWVSFSDPSAPTDRNVPGATTGPGRDSLKSPE